MANLKSSQKDIRRIERRTARNRVVTTRLKTLHKKVLTAQKDGDATALAELGRLYSSALDKAAKTGVIHLNKANRQKATMARVAKAVSAS